MTPKDMPKCPDPNCTGLLKGLFEYVYEYTFSKTSGKRYPKINSRLRAYICKKCRTIYALDLEKIPLDIKI